MCGGGKGSCRGGEVLWEVFAGYVPLVSQNPYPIIVDFWSVLLPIIDPILVTFGHYSLFLVYFLDYYRPHLSHFWANNFLSLKVPKKCDPILVTLWKVFEKMTPFQSVET